ncbi:hypothetical protein Tco_0458389 [Tanacetum coccineum]
MVSNIAWFGNTSIPAASLNSRSLLIDASEIETGLPSIVVVIYLTLLIVLDLAVIQNCSTNIVETTGLTATMLCLGRDSRATIIDELMVVSDEKIRVVKRERLRDIR